MPRTKMVVVKSEPRVGSQKMSEVGGDEDALDWKHYAMLLRKELHTKDLAVKAGTSKRKRSDKPPSEAQVRSRKEFKEKVAQAVAIHRKSKELFERGAGPKREWKACMAEVYKKEE